MSEKPLYVRIGLDRHGIVEAHAGTGKTYTLVRLVLRMLSEPMPHGRAGRPDLRNLLLVTYTEKAAGELKERIRKELVKAVRDLPESDDLRLHLQGNLDNLEEAWIGTIHGVCQRILKNYPFETRLPFATEMKDDAEGSATMLRTAMRGGWSSEPVCMEALGLLAEGQMSFSDDELDAVAKCAAILSDPSARQVLPDETDWRARLQSLVKEAKKIRIQVQEELPGYIESLKAFLACYESLEDLDSYACKKPVSTAQKNAWAHRMEEVKLALRLGFPDVALGKAKENGVLLLYKDQCSVKELGDLDHCRFQVETHAYIEALALFQNALRQCKNRLASQAVEIAASEWRMFKSRQGMLSFNDLLAVARDSVCDNEALRQALRSQFCYALIDEFQDTSLLQWELFERLFIGAAGDKPSPASSLFLVGDPKQSIYSFQGANVDTYIAAARTVGELGSAESLQVNFRSLPALIEACNFLISDPEPVPEAANSTAKGKGKKQKEEVQENWWKHPSLHYGSEEWAKAPERPQPEEESDKEIAPWLSRPLRYVPLRGKESHIKRRWASFVAKSIQGLCGRIVSLPDGDKWQPPRALGHGDFAVLAETNVEAQFYVDALAQAGIPVAKYKQDGIFQSEMAREVRIWCMAIQDFESDPGLLGKVLMTSLGNLTVQEAADLGGHEETVNRAVACLRYWRMLAQERRWARLVRSMQRDGGVESVLLRLADGDRRVSDLRQVLEYCHGYLDEGGHDLADLVEYLRDLENKRVETGRDGNLHQKESDSRSVQVMTMHASKGLQFPVVYIATRGAPVPRSPRAVRWVDSQAEEPGLRCFPQLFGSKESVASVSQQRGEVLGKEQAVQEKQRLYYVALTRAQLLLFVPCRLIVTVRGGKESVSCTDELSSRLQGWLDKDSTVAEHEEMDHLPPLAGMGGFEVKDSLRELEALPAVDEIGKEAQKALQDLKLPNRARREESYTSLTHATSAGERDVDCAQEVDVETVEIPSPQLEPLPLPRGKHIGIAWHGILEKLLSQNDLETMLASELTEVPGHCQELLEGELRRNGVLAAAKRQGLEDAAVIGATWKLCREALDLKWSWMEGDQAREVRLCALPASSRLPEVEFHLREGSEPLLGFMDLVFRLPLEDGGYRYYVLDWKSNSLDSYGQEAIAKSVREARYDDQARLYCHALDRWLSSRLKDAYDPARHLGGALYVYMRGLSEASQPLWFHPAAPDKDSARVQEMLGELSRKRGRDKF